MLLKQKMPFYLLDEIPNNNVPEMSGIIPGYIICIYKSDPLSIPLV